jgi:hypothetical protein
MTNPIQPTPGDNSPSRQDPPSTSSVNPTQAPDSAGPVDPTPLPDSAGPIPSPRRSRLKDFRASLRKALGYSPDLTPQQQITRRSFLSFSVFAVLGATAWRSWFWLKDSAANNGVQSPLRNTLDANGKIFKQMLSPNHHAPTYPTSAGARNVRYNGGVGLNPGGFNAADWRLDVTTLDGRKFGVNIDDLKGLPLTEFAFEFKCIEGWSQISWWGGVKFSDFVAHYGLQKETALDYVGLSTPDDEYYVGVDMPSAMHPQTLLCYQMNGKPLEPRHGAPLRLIIPIKYGVKNLKRIGKLYFSNDRPRDYWFERGYDYYCGL